MTTFSDTVVLPSTRPNTEVELSPFVRAHWREKGYCVHGEVTVFGKSRFIDHVAHTGSCSEPDYIVAIEMKRGADQSLRRQTWKLDTLHIADELWGVTISRPRKATIEKWCTYFGERYWTWTQPGLMSWDADKGLVEHAAFERHEDKHLKRLADKLLLVEENRGICAGWGSGDDHEYVTHWKLGCQAIMNWADGRGVFTTDECAEMLLQTLNDYKNPQSAMNRMLRALHDDGRLVKVGKRGRYNAYRRPEGD